MKKLLTILFLSAFTFNVGQSYDFVRFAESSGLSLAQVFSVYQHSNGAIAVGLVGGGFSLYNGKTFHNFSKNEGLGDATVNDIKEDSKGNLWLATNDGISKFNGKTFKNYKEQDRKVISWELVIDDKDNIYIATSDGLIKYDGKKFENITKKFLDKNPNIHYLSNPKKGLYVFGSKNKVWEYSNNRITEVKRFTGKRINGIFKINDQKIYVVANDSLFSYTNQKFWEINYFNKLKLRRVISLLEDSNNNLWVGTVYNGVYRINKNGVLNFNKKNGFTNLPIWSIIEDKNNEMWFGTDNGLYFLNHTSLQLYNNNKVLSDLWSIYVSPDNHVYCGTTSKGIFEFKNNKFKNLHIRRSPNQIYYKILKDENSNWWIATNHGLLFDGKNKSNYLKGIKFFDDKSIFSIIKDYNNNIWIGTDGYGLYRYNGKIFKKEKIDSVITIIETFLEDRQKNLWIGTDVGVYKYDGEKFTYPKELLPLKRFAVDHLIMDRYRNIIWGCSFGQGVFRYYLPSDSSKGKLQIFSTKDGLNDNSTLSIVEDFDGNVWVGTNKGLNKLIVNNSDSSVTIIPFYKSDGFIGSECVQQSAEIDSSGKLLVMTAHGLLTFYPNDLGKLKNKPIPKIISLHAMSLDSVATFSKDFLFMSDGKDNQYYIPDNINNVKITYCGLQFPSSEGTKYSYKLSDLKWSKPTYETSVNYNNLDPGDYTFSVRTLSAQNIPDQKIATIYFKVFPKFYQTLWFKILSVILFMLLGLLFTYIRTRTIRKKNLMLRSNIEERKKINSILRKAKETAEKSEKLKSEFLAQMSHEIRSPIHTILSFTQLLEFELSDKINDELKESFNAISKAGKRVVRTIDLVLNMSQIQTNTLETNFRNINLTDEILELLFIEYSQAAKSEGLKLSFIKDTENTNIEGDENTITQIVANLLNNAIKYTQKGEVILRVFRTSDNKLAVEVSDTGIGISKEYLPKIFDSFSQEEQGYTRHYDGNGLGLALVKKYCQINNAEITVESEKGKGSTFRVIFK